MNVRETADEILAYYELVGWFIVIMLIVAIDELHRRFVRQS